MEFEFKKFDNLADVLLPHAWHCTRLSSVFYKVCSPVNARALHHFPMSCDLASPLVNQRAKGTV
jgi:hypothetical protein